ncbi:MAG TPA: MATE family efflux transporter, partial [Flavisolibacter sp.]|nr:MATE family efflux transporter [Flavisolibacter sp.]
MFIIYLVIRAKGISAQFSLLKTWDWNVTVIRSIINMSGPLVFQHAISIISWFIFYLLIERNTDQTSLAVSNTMRNIFGFFGVFAWSFASTTNSMVSNVIGQGKHYQVLPLIHKIIRLSTGISLIVCLGLNLFPGAYLSVYGLDDDFITAGVPVIRLVAFAMVLMSFATVWLSAVTGTGNSRMTLLIEIAAIILYCIYVFVVLEVFQLSIFWGWMSELLYWSCLFTLSFFYIKRGKWQHKTI